MLSEMKADEENFFEAREVMDADLLIEKEEYTYIKEAPKEILWGDSIIVFFYINLGLAICITL